MQRENALLRHVPSPALLGARRICRSGVRALPAHHPTQSWVPNQKLPSLTTGERFKCGSQRWKEPLISTPLPNPLVLMKPQLAFCLCVSFPRSGHHLGLLWAVAESALSHLPRATNTPAISGTVTEHFHRNLLRLQGTKCFELISFYFLRCPCALVAFLGRD